MLADNAIQDLRIIPLESCFSPGRALRSGRRTGTIQSLCSWLSSPSSPVIHALHRSDSSSSSALMTPSVAISKKRLPFSGVAREGSPMIPFPIR